MATTPQWLNCARPQNGELAVHLHASDQVLRPPSSRHHPHVHMVALHASGASPTKPPPPMVAAFLCASGIIGTVHHKGHTTYIQQACIRATGLQDYYYNEADKKAHTPARKGASVPDTHQGRADPCPTRTKDVQTHATLLSILLWPRVRGSPTADSGAPWPTATSATMASSSEMADRLHSACTHDT